jgi:hypothetical protein
MFSAYSACVYAIATRVIGMTIIVYPPINALMRILVHIIVDVGAIACNI